MSKELTPHQKYRIERLAEDNTQEELLEALKFKSENDDLFDDLQIPQELYDEICDTFKPHIRQIPIPNSNLFIQFTIKPTESYLKDEKRLGRIYATCFSPVTVEYTDEALEWEEILADRANLDFDDYGTEGYSILKSHSLSTKYTYFCDQLTPVFNGLLTKVEKFAESIHTPIGKTWEVLDKRLPEDIYNPLWDLYRDQIHP